LGEILQQAGLVSAAQVDVALREQEYFSDMRLGEILASHGWLKQETVDFFAQRWPHLSTQKQVQKLGYYLLAAGLLDEQQINAILKEQWQTGLRLGALAVLKGWMKQQTLDFFLKNLVAQRHLDSPFAKKQEKAVLESEHKPASSASTSADKGRFDVEDDESGIKWVG
jgi:hypothetical protein